MATAPTPPPFTRLDAVALLRQVIDPEVGLDIVDLGLVYDLHLHDRRVDLAMTMTTPACPLGRHLSEQALAALRALPDLQGVTVRLVWTPAWTPAMMAPRPTPPRRSWWSLFGLG